MPWYLFSIRPNPANLEIQLHGGYPSSALISDASEIVSLKHSMVGKVLFHIDAPDEQEARAIIESAMVHAIDTGTLQDFSVLPHEEEPGRPQDAPPE